MSSPSSVDQSEGPAALPVNSGQVGFLTLLHEDHRRRWRRGGRPREPRRGAALVQTPAGALQAAQV